jgi:hypothetical protein
MSIEAMKLALEALEELHRTGDTQVFDLCYAPKVIPALRTAIEQAEKQEPVAWVCNHYEAGVKNDVDYWQDDIDALPVGTPLYTTPPAAQRKLLTDEEIMQTWEGVIKYAPGEVRLKDFARAIEAKLKEKNT